MAVSYRIDPSGGRLTVALSGTVTGDDLETLSERLKHDAAYDPSLPVLVDATKMSSGALPTRTVVARASVPRPHRTRIAIAASADAVYGIARMYQMLAEDKGGEIGVFRSLAEAEAWLTAGTPSAHARP